MYAIGYLSCKFKKKSDLCLTCDQLLFFTFCFPQRFSLYGRCLTSIVDGFNTIFISPMHILKHFLFIPVIHNGCHLRFIFSWQCWVSITWEDVHRLFRSLHVFSILFLGIISIPWYMRHEYECPTFHKLFVNNASWAPNNASITISLVVEKEMYWHNFACIVF